MSLELEIENTVETTEVAPLTSRWSRWLAKSWPFLLLPVGVGLLLLVFSGPQIGSTFSAVSKGLGGGPVSSQANSPNSPASNAGNGSSSPQTQPWDRKIIRTANLTVVVSNMEQTLAELRAVAVSEGGLVFQESTGLQDKQATGLLVLQIPAQSFENVITKIRRSALKVTREEASSQDVTEEYVDLQSQINNLRRTEEGLQKLIDKAQKLEDVLAVERELSNVRGEIEKRQGRLNFLDKRTTYSTITLNLSLPPVEAAPVSKSENFQPVETATNAWNVSLKLLAKVATAGITVVVFLWWVFPFVIIGLALWRWRLRPAAQESRP